MFDERGLTSLSHEATVRGRARRARPRQRLLLAIVALLAMACLGVAPGVAASNRPVLGARGQTLKWTPVGRHRVYKLMINVARHKRVLTVRGHHSIRPRPYPGATAVYRVKAAYGESGWSNPVIINYPLPSSAPSQANALAAPPAAVPGVEASETLEAEPAPGTMLVGVNAGGWDASAFADLSGATKYVRLESRFANDAEVAGAAASGVSVATWLVGAHGTIGSIDPAAYAAEVVALFKRYGRGGTFWRGRKRDLGGRAVEVLNEPGGAWFWTDPKNYAAYATLLKTVHEALVANFPAAIRPRVLASWDGGAGPESRFGAGWAALGGLAYCDGVTVHPYGASDGSAGGALGSRRDVEAARAATGLPVYVTEVGWPTATGQPSTPDSQQWTEAQQAENITGFVRWARATGYVAMVIVFNFVDYGTATWYGIERSDRSHKPAFAALAKA